MVTQHRSPTQYLIDANGDPISGGQKFFYAEGTLTKLSVFQDESLLISFPNPVVADAAGMIPPIWLAQTRYKTVTKTSTGAPIETIDPVVSGDTTYNAPTIIASATTTDLSNASGVNATITGTTTITAFGIVQNGAHRYITFTEALTLAHDGTSLILPGEENITTIAGDTAFLISLGSGNWRLRNYSRKDGTPTVIMPHQAIAPPTVTDDADIGFRVGDRWQDTAALRSYELFNSTPGAAVWVSATSDPWATKFVGERVETFDHIPGFTPPPKDQGYRYVLLSAGESGSGEYNEGVVTNEVISGTSPNIVASFDIDLPASPFHGQTIDLMNTEGTFVRGGEVAGVKQWSQNLAHTHVFTGTNQNTATGSSVSGGLTQAQRTTDSTGGDEARPRNISARWYMRIL